MKRLLSLSLWIGLLSITCSTVQAQEHAVSGTVTDAETGTPLPGVNVVVAGTPTGTATDREGHYSLTVSSVQDTLVFSFIGYEARRIPVDGRSEIDVQLSATVLEGEEVVVVGYGSTQRTALTGSVASVEVAKISDVPAARVDQLLRGRAAGVQVTSVSGAPGAETTIRVRGGNSISASNEPLYVIDGVIGAGDLTSINPNDIASIEILKDATATAIYGARGANGVVLITTKSGFAGEDRVNVRISRGWQTLPHTIDMMNAEQYARLANDYARYSGQPIPYENPASLGTGTPWQEAITRVAPMTDVQLSAVGGSEEFQYYVSGSYFNQRGIIINSGIERYQFRINLDKDIGERLTIGNRLNISRSDEKNNTIALGGYGYDNSALATPPVVPVYNEAGEFAYQHPVVSFPIDNPVAQGKLPLDGYTSTQVLGNVFAAYELTPALTLKSTFGVDASFDKSNSYTPGRMPTRRLDNLGGAASVSTSQRYTLLNENTLTYDQALGENHRLNALAGFTYQASSYESLFGSADRFNNDVTTYNNLSTGAPETRGVDSGYESWTIVSYLGRVRYSFLDRYLFTLVGRYDGSSRLGKNHQWAFFPSGAFAWRLGQEPFVERLDVFSTLKLRVSFGYTGNQAVGVYATLPTLSQTSYIFGGQETLAFVPGGLPNPDLKWETTRQLDIGLDAGFFNGRLELTVDYYRKRTNDLLLDVEIPWQTGYTSILRNIGAVENQGLEFSLQSTNIQTTDFGWETSFNISTNENTVVDLGDKDQVITHRYSFGVRPTSFLKEGQPVGTFYGAVYLGTWKTEEEIEQAGTMPGAEPGSPRYKDVDGNGVFNVEDYVPIGSATPDVFGGLGNTVHYKNLSLNIFFQFSYGNEVFNGSDGFLATSDPLTNQYAYMVDRWTPQNRDSDIPKVGSRDYVPSTRWVHDGSFLRLKTVQLSYAVPIEQLGWSWLRSASISLTGRNLILWDRYNGYDPEVNTYGDSSTLRGYDFAEYPRARTFTVGLNLGF